MRKRERQTTRAASGQAKQKQKGAESLRPDTTDTSRLTEHWSGTRRPEPEPPDPSRPQPSTGSGQSKASKHNSCPRAPPASRARSAAVLGTDRTPAERAGIGLVFILRSPRTASSPRPRSECKVSPRTRRPPRPGLQIFPLSALPLPGRVREGSHELEAAGSRSRRGRAGAGVGVKQEARRAARRPPAVPETPRVRPSSSCSSDQ